MKKALLFHSFLLGSYLVVAQLGTQSVRGRIIDADSRSPLFGANIVILDSEPFKGAISDEEGYYVIHEVKLGRIDVKVTYLGYEERVISNVMVGSGKEVLINAELTESLTQIEGVEITGRKNAGLLNDEMSVISARSFSVEETKRYAGSFDDPARMASAFAGVNSNPEGNNDIVVRGNSPRGILWRMEGIEIPNPNHFSDLGSTGGAISALNSAMLSNSDFYTGAFSPAYGNALSGIFDINLREGNYSRIENKIGLGALGADISSEGPFKKGSPSTYLFNYRYSSLALLDALSLVDFEGVPKYQDLSYHVKLHTNKAGIFSFFGLAGLSGISQEIFDEKDENLLIEKNEFTAFTANAGVKHLYLFSERTFIESIANLSEQANTNSAYDGDSAGNMRQDDDLDMKLMTPRFSVTLHHKINARNKIMIGAIHSIYTFDLFYEYYDDEFNQRLKLFDARGKSSSTQGFVSWKYRHSERLSLVSGLHFMWFDLSDTYSMEPRLAADYEIAKGHAVSAGFGIHSRLEPVTSYFVMPDPGQSTEVLSNNTLKSSKARHYVVGYKYRRNPDFLGMLEFYYQELYDVPVEDDTSSSFSMINTSDWFPNKMLINEGTGWNAGVELTLERYFTRNYYYLLTLSLYESKYKALDGIERNTRYNNNYLANLLFGREFAVKKTENKLRLFNVSIRLSYSGGQYYTALDEQKSVLNGIAIYSGEEFAEKAEDITQVNLSMSYRIERKNTSQVIKIDILNLTNNQARLYPYFNEARKTVEWSTQLAMIPNISYVIEF